MNIDPKILWANFLLGFAAFFGFKLGEFVLGLAMAQLAK